MTLLLIGLALTLALLVQSRESRAREVDLAAHVDPAGNRLTETHRDGPQRPQIRGDVLAGEAIAAGRAADEDAVLVGQINREPIDLELAVVCHVPGHGLSHPLVEGAKLLL